MSPSEPVAEPMDQRTDAGPLHALGNGVDGGNAVYAYGGAAFPTQTYQASNYWVDVLFIQ